MHPVHLASRGHMAWDDTLLAVGSSSLSLYSLSHSSLNELQTIPSKHPITSMEWSKTTESILATGSSSGIVSFYKKSSLLSDPSKSFLKEDKIIDNMTVGSLQFCPSKPNLLAIGANELFIYNLEAGLTSRDPTKYVFKLGKSSMDGKRLTSIAWNPQVQYILAAATQNCAASVWDLRGNQTLFNVHDANYLNKSFCSGIAWNPDIPTQFIMAYDDSTTPNLQIWDLRKHEQPVKELKTNHNSGITALSWCPYDSSVFASSDRSGFTNLWSFKQCQTFMKVNHSVAGAPCSIKWVPRQPGVVSFGFEDGEIEIRNVYTPAVETGTRTSSSDHPSEVIKPNIVHTPLYLLKKAPTSFGYNGKLASLYLNSNKIIQTQLNPTSSPLKSKVEKAHQLFSSGKLSELCSYFSEFSSESGKLQWELIASKLSGNISNVASLLGFDRRAVERATEKQTGKKRSTHEEAPSGRKESFHDTFSFVDLSAVDAVDFFNKAGAKHEEVKQQVETLKSEPEFVQTIMETISKNVNWDEGLEKLIRENIILGNLEAAIDCALVCGRTAEALIIAHQGGPELFNITQEAVLNSSKDRFLKNNLLNLLKKDVGEIIENCEYGKWKEVLAILIINNSKPAVVAQFAEKLEDAGFNEAAEVCYIYSGYSERVIESWVRKYRQALSDGEDRESEIFSLFFKALLHSESFNFSGSELLERIYLEYLSLLFSKGLISQGFDIMKQLKTPKHSMALMIFVERHTKANTGTSKAPWKLMNIVPVKGKEVKPVEVKKQDRPVFTRENVVPDVKKAAFNEIPKPVRPVPEPVRQPEPLRQAFPEPPKPVFQEGKSARPVVDKGNLPPPPPVFHSNAEIKKSPFGEIKTVGPSLESKQITPASGTSNASLPPPPPIKKESKVDPPPLRQEFKTVEHPSRPEPKEDLIPPPENPKPRPEERKSVTPSTPSPSVPFAPSVPKTIPPPRPGVGFPLKPQSKSLKPTTEGLDLSGIPASSLSISQKWETSFQDWCTGNNAKIIKDVESKLQEFFNKLKSQEINEVTLSQVRSLTEAFESGDFNTTNKEYLELCSRNWEENKNWLTAMKRIIQGKQAPKGK